MKSVSHVLLSLALLLSTASAFPGSDRLRQTTRTDVVGREKFPELFNKRQSSQAACVCPDGTACPGDCESMCSSGTKRSTMEYGKRGELTIPRSAFGGDVISPSDAATLLQGDGTFFHSNGTYLTDYAYVAHSDKFRRFYQPKPRAFMDWAKRGVTRLTVPYMAKGLVTRFTDTSRIFPISDNFAIENRDVIRMLAAFLSDPTLQEVWVWHYRLSRGMIEELVGVLCPRMGRQYCDGI